MALLLRETEIVEILTFAEGVRLVEESFRLHALGEVSLPPRMALKLSGDAGMFRVMSASIPGIGSFGLKVLTGIPGKRQAHRTYFVMLLFDAITGALSGILPATHLTVVRTGGAGGVAVKYLARPDASSLGILGAGVQGRAQVAAIREVRSIAVIRVFDTNQSQAESLATQLRQQGVRALVVKDPKEAVVGSDIVVCATTSTEAILRGAWLKNGTHVNAIGANSPTKRELDADAFERSKLTVDFKEQVLLEGGDLIDAISSGVLRNSHIYAELGEIVAGEKPGRESLSEITVFKSVGVAFQDITVASWVLQQASARKLGTWVDLED